jgi:hypothetical protein
MGVGEDDIISTELDIICHICGCMPDEDVAFKDLNQKHNNYQFGL